MTLEDIALGMQGIGQLRDPIAENIRQYMYYQVITMNPELAGVSYAEVKGTYAEYQWEKSVFNKK